MEPRKNLTEKELGDDRPRTSDRPDTYFRKALAFTLKYYSKEMEHISSTKFEELTPEKFFLECMWVIHATGFNAQVVGQMMPKLVTAYGQWNILGHENIENVLERVCKICNNPAKIESVRSIAGIMVGTNNWENFKQDRLSSPDKLKELPYIGKVTCFHLARNIGLLDSVKPDLHLVRLAKYWGYRDCIELCKYFQESHEKKTGTRYPLGIIDLILWYAASSTGTLDIRKSGER
ncbi:MAG: hypothetical protein WC708_01000 [Lentisphaeria bacterium]|jgi:hypothetical protein